MMDQLFKDAISGCGRYLVPGDGQDRCLMCLGIKHAKVAFVDDTFPLREDDHLEAADQASLPPGGRSSVASAMI